MNLITQTSLLLLWIHTLTFVTSQECTLQQFLNSRLYDGNFDTTTMQNVYQSGQQVRVGCNVGYSGFFKLTCTQGKWTSKGSNCEPKSCGHPGDAQFADFRLDRGTDFVFGSRVVYTCHKGYQMQNRINYRNCMDQGWDGIVPICEAITCPSLDVDDKLHVNGDLLQATYRNVVQFSCKSSREILSGSPQIVCDENGKWSAPPPTCQVITCSEPSIENGFVLQRGKEYYENDVLHFMCSDGYSHPDDRPSVCVKVGIRAEWRPTPICEQTKCRLTLPPVAGTSYEPAFRNLFVPGETLNVTCGEKFWIVGPKQTSAQATCNKEGEWSVRPVCQEVTCPGQRERDVYDWDVYWGQRLTLGKTVRYTCRSNYRSSDGSNLAKCTRDGWMPKPLCQEIKCDRQELQNAELYDPRKQVYRNYEVAHYVCKEGYEGQPTRVCRDVGWTGDSECSEKGCQRPEIANADFPHGTRRNYRHNEQVEYTCRRGGQVRFTATCERGVWTGTLKCTGITCDRRDYPYADIDGEPQSEYRSGDRVDYICKNGYEGSFSLTCGRGSWIRHSDCTKKLCPKPPIENADFATRVKDNYTDNEQVQYTCWSNSEVQYTATCDRGVWTGIHTCTVTECEMPEIENGFAVGPYNGKLYYTCDTDYKLFAKGGWGEATCADKEWTGLGQCIEKNKCGEIPVIPNGNMASHEALDQNESILVVCKEGFQATVKRLQCQDGDWKTNEALRNICRPLASNCKLPPKFENAVVVAPPKKQYLTDSEVTYECRSKFEMEGGGKLRCNNGKWENVIRCTPYCDKPKGDATQSFTVQPDKEKYKNLEDIVYQCARPGGENSSGTAKCVNGKWNRTVAC